MDLSMQVINAHLDREALELRQENDRLLVAEERLNALLEDNEVGNAFSCGCSELCSS
jgi:hypothetical protein